MRVPALLFVIILPLIPQVTTNLSDDLKRGGCIAALDAKTFSLLETHPHLAVARNWIDNNAQVDVLRHTVRSSASDALGPAREIQCQPLADGLRQTFPGSRRVRITTPCVVRFTKAPAKSRRMIAVIEREGDGVLAELYMEDNRPLSLTIGNMLPTTLPARMPDLSEMKFGKLQTRFFQADQNSATEGGFTGGYTLYLNLQSQVSANELFSKLKAVTASSEGVYDTSSSATEFSWLMRSPAHTGVGRVLSTEISPGTWLHEFIVKTGLSKMMVAGSESESTNARTKVIMKQPRGLDEPQCM